MPAWLRDLFLPRTDFAVFVQVAVITPLWLLLLFLLRRSRDWFLFVLGAGLLGLALTGLRAAH